jgi:hypothetical protein
MKSTNGRTFGGYISRDLTGDNNWYNDPNAFIFQLDDLARFNLKNPGDGRTYFSADGFGSVFGDDPGLGNDIHVANNANSNTDSYINFGASYQLPAGINYISIQS